VTDHQTRFRTSHEAAFFRRLFQRLLSLSLVLTACGGASVDNGGSDQVDRADPAEPDRATATSVDEPQPTPPSIQPGDSATGLFAISIRQLQRELRACGGFDRCRDEVLLLGGITEVLGYVEDAENQDLVLFGASDGGRPPIRSEDFAVALRNAWLEYAPVQNGTVTYSYPGCDIRPTRETRARLTRVGNDLQAAGMQEAEPLIEAWKEVCREEQTVTVFGVPQNTHFSDVMVTADYDLKDLANGSSQLDLPGLTSLSDLHLAAAKAVVLGGEPLTLSTYNRFWLLAGEVRYEKTSGVMVVDVPVRVDTHRIGESASGELVDVEGADPLAEKFARDLSLLYDKLAGVAPEYRELENLFHLFAVAQVMRLERPHEKVGLDLDALLGELPLEDTEVEAALPGRSNVERFVHRQETAGGFQEIRLWLPSCGGVDMTIKPRREGFVEEPGGLEALERTVIAARTAPDARSWPVALPQHGPPAGPLIRRRLRDLNLPGAPLVVRVVKDGARYQLHTTDDTRLYSGPDVRPLLRRVQQQASAAGASTSYLVLDGFSEKDAETFRRTYRLHATTAAPDLSVRVLHGIADTDLETALFTPGVRLVEISPIRKDPKTGWMRAVVDFAVMVRGAIRHLTVVVFARTAEWIDGFLERLQIEFSVHDSLPLSATALMDGLQRQYMREQGLSEDDFQILVEDQVLGTHWVWLSGEQEARAA